MKTISVVLAAFATTTILAGPTPGAAGSGPSVSGVRIGEHADMTRVVLDLTGPAKFGYKIAENGAAVLVTLPGSHWRTASASRRARGVVSGYAFKRRGQGSDLAIATFGPVTVKRTLVLRPDGRHGHRIVIDLARGAPRAASMSRAAVAPHLRPIETFGSAQRNGVHQPARMNLTLAEPNPVGAAQSARTESINVDEWLKLPPPGLTARSEDHPKFWPKFWRTRAPARSDAVKARTPTESEGQISGALDPEELDPGTGLASAYTEPYASRTPASPVTEIAQAMFDDTGPASFTGYQVGLHGGLAIGDHDVTFTSGTDRANFDGAGGAGFASGPYLGLGTAIGRYYLGGEVDYTLGGADVDGSVNTNDFDVDIDQTFGASGRLGYLLGDQTMGYVRLGFAYSEVDVSSDQGLSDSSWEPGVSYGIGFEQLLGDRLTLRGELLGVTYSSFATSEGTETIEASPVSYTARLGLGYMF